MRIWNLNDIQTMALVFAWLQNQNQLQRIESKLKVNVNETLMYPVYRLYLAFHINVFRNSSQSLTVHLAFAVLDSTFVVTKIES